MNKQLTDPVQVSIDMPRQVDEEVAGDIEKESVFVSPAIDRIVVGEDGNSATVMLKDSSDLDAVMDKAARFLDVMAKQVSGYEIKVFFETKRRDDGPYQRDVNQGLAERGWLHDYGMGQVAYNGPVLKLARLINEKAAELYRREYDATDGHFPALVDADTLHKCGYFDSHPNAVTFVGNMIEDFDAIEEFRMANSCSEGAHMPPQDHVHVDGMCLNPAACFPAYPTLSGKRYETGECFTWMGRVFPLRVPEHLRSRPSLRVQRARIGLRRFGRLCQRRAQPLAPRSWKSWPHSLTSTASCRRRRIRSSQRCRPPRNSGRPPRRSRTKSRFPVLDADGNTKTIACGSINLHGNFFGERFDIQDQEGNPRDDRLCRSRHRALGSGRVHPARFRSGALAGSGARENFRLTA